MDKVKEMNAGNGGVKVVFGPGTDRSATRHSNPVSHSHSRSPTHYGSTDHYRLTSSPERIRRSDSGTLLNVVPEDRIMVQFSPTIEPVRTPMYTAGAPLDEDEEEREWEWQLDEELEEQGLYRGSYKRLILLYTLSPLTFLIVAALLSLLPYLIYPTTQPWPYPSVPYLPHPFPELLTSTALFSLSHLLRTPLTSLFSLLPPLLATLLSTSTHTLLSLTLQQSSLALLLVAEHTPARPTTRDAAFRRVWWLALGWATAEALVATCQGYEARALYRDVLVSVRRTATGAPEEEGTAGKMNATLGMGPISSSSVSMSGSGSRSPRENLKMTVDGPTRAGQSTLELFESQVEDDVYGERRAQPFREEEAGNGRNGNGSGTGEREPLLPKGVRGREQAIQLLVEDEVEELLAMRAREELEDAYGVPIIRIPVFILCLQRINALLLTLGTALLLAQAYLRSPLSFPSLSSLSIHAFTTPPNPAPIPKPSNLLLYLTAPTVWALHTYLALLHTPLVLPRMGVPAVVYNASLVSLGVFFAGMALWEGLS